MILLRPRSKFGTQKSRRGMTLKVSRPERESNITGRSTLVDALSPIFDQTSDQLRVDVEGELRAQRLAGRSRLSMPVRALELNENRFRDDMQEAMLQGISVGAVAGLGVYLWMGNAVMGLVLGLALLGNMLVAGIIGTLVPVGLKTLRLDPALASSVLVTAVTDSVGFALFLSLAVIFLPHLR